MNRITAALAGILILATVTAPAHPAWDVTILNPTGAGCRLAFGGGGTYRVGDATTSGPVEQITVVITLFFKSRCEGHPELIAELAA